MTEQFSIQDVANMIASVQNIEQTMTDNKELLTALNGRQDETEKDVAVLEKGAEEHEKQHKTDRETHSETHKDLNSKINKVGLGNFTIAALITTVSAIFGAQK